MVILGITAGTLDELFALNFHKPAVPSRTFIEIWNTSNTHGAPLLVTGPYCLLEPQDAYLNMFRTSADNSSAYTTCCRRVREHDRLRLPCVEPGEAKGNRNMPEEDPCSKCPVPARETLTRPSPGRSPAACRLSDSRTDGSSSGTRKARRWTFGV